MADYIYLMLSVFVLNAIPAFMPPTWVLLALAKLNDSSFDPLALTVVGAFASTAGRAVLYCFSSFFRRFFNKDMELHADEIHKFFEKKGKELFFGTFLYALSPFPSNLIFIANGLTKTDYRPVFAGFFLGRLVSYYVLIALSQNLFFTLNNYTGNQLMTTYALEALGIIAAFSVVFVDWKKFTKKK
jgi:uncharacterized membrane protein YdjX (TVP38/TMEM64 family)